MARPSRKQLAWALPLLLVAAVGLHERRALAAAAVSWSEFERVGTMYFAPRIPVATRAQLRTALASAGERVREFYGSLRARPTIIVADEQTLSRFTTSSVAVTYYTPTGAITVLGPAGQNVDVMAYELAHAELFSRLGYRTLDWCVPTWFDEGLAVQFDQRPMYSEAAFVAKRASGWELPPLATLSSRAAFFSGAREQVRFRYAGARSAVAGWLRRVGRAEALRRIAALACGEAALRELDQITVPGK